MFILIMLTNVHYCDSYGYYCGCFCGWRREVVVSAEIVVNVDVAVDADVCMWVDVIVALVVEHKLWF